MESNSEIVIYKNPEGNIRIDVTIEGETVWLNQSQMEALFQTDRTSIVKHIQNIYETNELLEVQLVQILHKFKKSGQGCNQDIKSSKN